MATILIVSDSDARQIANGCGDCIDGPTVTLSTAYDADGDAVHVLTCSRCGDVTPVRQRGVAETVEAGSAHVDRCGS